MRRTTAVLIALVGALLASVPAGDCAASPADLPPPYAVARSLVEPCATVPIGARPPAAERFVVGRTEYVLRYGGAAGQGEYFALDLSPLCAAPCASSGATYYRCAWEQGVRCCLETGSCLPGLPGNLSGSTARAVQSRFDLDTDQRQGIWYDEYHGNGARRIHVPGLGASSDGCYPVDEADAFFLTRPAGTANSSVIYCQYLGRVDLGPVPAAPVTWGTLKLLYR